MGVGARRVPDLHDRAASVFKAVYLDDRELTCACAGGDSKVPLGFVSLTESLAMIAMAVWMATKHLL